MTTIEHIDTVVIGGGQAGLAVGYHLQRRGVPFAILDAEKRIGDAWRKRWDSLKLFTPARFSGLPGLAHDRPGDAVLTKDEMADYLERYARHFDLPVRLGTRVQKLARGDDDFVVTTNHSTVHAAQVVVAMSTYQKPRVPAFASRLDPSVQQIHSSRYRHPDQIQGDKVLVVGVGNSGADIALELAGTRETWLSGTPSAVVPFRIEGWFGRHLGVRLVYLLGTYVLSWRSPIGRRVLPKMRTMAAPLVRVKPQDLEDAGVKRVPRVVGVDRDRVRLAGGDTVAVDAVVWCTGFKPAFDWIRLPVFDADGHVRHTRGAVEDEPGLYFVGLHLLTAMTSDTLAGVGRDAEYVVGRLAARRAERLSHPASALPMRRSA